MPRIAKTRPSSDLTLNANHSTPKAPARRPAVFHAPAAVDSAAALRQLQRVMLGAVSAPLTADMHMKKRTPRGASASKMAATFIKPNNRLTSFERLEIYNRQYWFRLFDSLYDDFPGLRAVLGEARFMAMSEAYLIKYPSRSFSLRDLGDRLGAFLAECPRWAGKNQPVALDVVRLEWAQITAFDSAACAPLGVDDLLGADPARLSVRLQPHISLLALQFPVDDFVNALKPEQALQTEAAEELRAPRSRRQVRLPTPKDTFLAVHRFENRVYFKHLERPAYEILRNLSLGWPVQDVCEKFLAEAKDGRDWAETLKLWFANWSELGWLCA